MKQRAKLISNRHGQRLWYCINREMCISGFTKEIEEEAKRLQKEFMPEDTNAGIIQAFLDDYDDDYVCTRTFVR